MTVTNGKNGRESPPRRPLGPLTAEELEASRARTEEANERGRLRRELRAILELEVRKAIDKIKRPLTSPMFREELAAVLEMLAKEVRRGK